MGQRGSQPVIEPLPGAAWAQLLWRTFHRRSPSCTAASCLLWAQDDRHHHGISPSSSCARTISRCRVRRLYGNPVSAVWRCCTRFGYEAGRVRAHREGRSQMRDGAVGAGDEPVAPAVEPSRSGDDKKGPSGVQEGGRAPCPERARAGPHRRAEDIGGVRPGAQHPDRSVKSANAFGYQPRHHCRRAQYRVVLAMLPVQADRKGCLS